MPFRYSDYLLTPRDLGLGLLHVVRHLRRRDVVGEAAVLLIIVLAKWHRDASAGFALAAGFSLLYWDAPLRQGLRTLLRHLDLNNAAGWLMLIVLAQFARNILLWPTDAILLLLVIVACRYWQVNARTASRWSLAFLALCPLLLLARNVSASPALGTWLERAAELSFYFLSIGFLHLLRDLRQNNRRENI